MNEPQARATRTFDTRVHRSGMRVTVMVLVGLFIAVLVGTLRSWSYAPALGWAGACLVYLVWVWSVIANLDGSATASHARREDPTRKSSDVLVLAATLGSFGGVALILLDAGTTHGDTKAAVVGTALGCVALSWLLVHTLYTLRYAALFYRDHTGVDFNENELPRYQDFAYLAFTIGMTFQVSDTNLTTRRIRSTALRHALLSYVLGAVVLATTINLVSGLIH